MQYPALCVGSLFLMALVGSGCDSGQYGQETTPAPKATSRSIERLNASATLETTEIEETFLARVDVVGAKENNEGVRQYRQGHWDVAHDHFKKALAANADLVEAHYNLALALDKLGEHGDATAHFKKALDLVSENPSRKDSSIPKPHLGG